MGEKFKFWIKIVALLLLLVTGNSVLFAQQYAWRHYTTDDGLLDNMTNRLLEDNDDNIWFGSYVAKGGGIGYIKDGQVSQSFQIKDGLVHNAITSLALVNQSQILVGGGVYTTGGANVLAFDSIEWTISDVILKKDGLAGEKVRHIYIDSECNRWFCSEYDGIAVFNDDYTPISLITTM
jgi:hypothetical protein